jgi:hypothetical protein
VEGNSSVDSVVERARAKRLEYKRKQFEAFLNDLLQGTDTEADGLDGSSDSKTSGPKSGAPGPDSGDGDAEDDLVSANTIEMTPPPPSKKKKEILYSMKPPSPPPPSPPCEYTDPPPVPALPAVWLEGDHLIFPTGLGTLLTQSLYTTAAAPPPSPPPPPNTGCILIDKHHLTCKQHFAANKNDCAAVISIVEACEVSSQRCFQVRAGRTCSYLGRKHLQHTTLGLLCAGLPVRQAALCYTTGHL